MAGITDPRPPLPEWILECYDLLCSRADQLDNEGVIEGFSWS